VLVEGDDLAEPISDSCRAILDGHLVLSRRIASQNHFPAVDVLESVSRVTTDVLSPEEVELAGTVRDILSTYRDAEDLIAVGAYKRGASSKIDRAIDLIDGLRAFLRQNVRETADDAGAWARLRAMIHSQSPPAAATLPVS
jgi:flagellum-specific ATP synthase